jgi:protein phosphatase
VGFAEMEGWRDNMEDEQVICLSMDNHPLKGFFGVFDGHCGNLASKFCKLNFMKVLDGIEDHSNLDVLVAKMILLDKKFLESTEEFRQDGTTAIFTIVTPVLDDSDNVANYKVLCGNIGDSRAVLGTPNRAIALSEDHKPDDINERRRIEQTGGFVQNCRVNGNLALSRAIGDRSYKIPLHCEPEKKQVTCIPDFKSEIVDENSFLLITCDGIYENNIFNTESIVQWINEKLRTTDDIAQISASLMDECLRRGSKDNMSAMIIQFKNGSDYCRDDEYIPGPYHDRESFQKSYTYFAQLAGYTMQQSMQLYENLMRYSTIPF